MQVDTQLKSLERGHPSSRTIGPRNNTGQQGILPRLLILKRYIILINDRCRPWIWRLWKTSTSINIKSSSSYNPQFTLHFTALGLAVCIQAVGQEWNCRLEKPVCSCLWWLELWLGLASYCLCVVRYKPCFVYCMNTCFGSKGVGQIFSSTGSFI